MSSLYFSGDWIITSVKPVFQLAEAAKNLGSELVALHPFEMTSEGYAVATLVLHVPSKDVLQTLITISTETLGQIDWNLVSEEPFLEGQKVHLDKSEPGLTNARAVDVWFFAARRNAIIRGGYSAT